MAAPAAVSGRKGTQPLGQFQGVSVALAHSVPRQMDWNRQLPRRPRPSEVHKHCSSPYGSLLSHAEKLHRCAADHPRPRVVFGMVVFGAAGVRLLRVGGCAWSGAVYMSRPLFAQRMPGSATPTGVGEITKDDINAAENVRRQGVETLARAGDQPRHTAGAHRGQQAQ